MSEKKYHIVYKTTCLVNGRYYIGCHATDDLNDGYLGSGPELKKDIARFGKSAFVRETLYECSSLKEAALKEREVANRDVVNDPNCYNQQIGGGVRGVKLGRSEEALEHERRRFHEDPIYRARQIKNADERRRKRYKNDPIYRARQNKRLAEYKRKKRKDPIFRERERAYDREFQRKKRRKKRFKENFTTLADFRSTFILCCKSDATLLQKTLELFKRDAEFCELLKNLIEK